MNDKQNKVEAKKQELRNQAMLSVVRSVSTAPRFQSWANKEAIVAAVKAGELTVVKTESRSRVYDYKFLDKESLSTYDGCSDFILEMENDRTFIVLRIWDGDNCTGERMGVRVTYELEGNWQVLPFFVEAVGNHFAAYCLRIYDTQLEQARLEAAKSIGASILAGMVPPSSYVRG